jgi:hypothetical protein
MRRLTQHGGQSRAQWRGALPLLPIMPWPAHLGIRHSLAAWLAGRLFGCCFCLHGGALRGRRHIAAAACPTLLRGGCTSAQEGSQASCQLHQLWQQQRAAFVRVQSLARPCPSERTSFARRSCASCGIACSCTGAADLQWLTKAAGKLWVGACAGATARCSQDDNGAAARVYYL